MSKEVTKAVALFNWISSRKMNDKKIGELSMSDILEMVRFLSEGGSDATH